MGFAQFSINNVYFFNWRSSVQSAQFFTGFYGLESLADKDLQIKIGSETLSVWKKLNLPVLVCLILRFLVGWLILVSCPSEVFISPFLIGKFLRTIGKTETGIQLRSCRRELSEIRDYWLSKPQMFSNLSWRDNMANNKKLNSHCCREKLVSYGV